MFFSNIDRSLPTVYTISSAFSVAITLNIAFPPTVKAEMIAVITMVTNTRFQSKYSDRLIVRTAPKLPLTIPLISPITSWQTEDTLVWFFNKYIAFLAPFNFLDALAWRFASSAVNTVALRTSNGYLFASYFNQGSAIETPTDDSNWIFCNSDGYFRKATKSSLESKLYPYEANLRWGGKNHSGSFGPLDAAMVPELGACRTMFVDGDAIDVQYSTDGGSTWTNYGATKAQKQSLFSNGSTFMLAPNISVGTNYTNYQLRIIINTSAAHVYTILNKFVIYLSTNGSQGTWCTIDGRLQTNVNSGTNTWTTFVDKVAVSGWSGYNVINAPAFTTYGNNAGSQYGQVRFTFGNTGYSTSYSGLRVSNIYCFGGVGWETPSTMAKTGHLYSFDHDQNATFPAQVTATQFNGSSSSVRDSGTGAVTTFAYSKPGMDSTSWLAAWNGYELRAIAPNKILSGSDITSKLGLGSYNASTTWGTITAANGYTLRWGADLASGGGIVIGEKSGKASLQIDGDIYVDEGSTRLAKITEIPTNTNQLTNGAGFITSITKSMVTTALGYTPPTSDTNTTYAAGTGVTISGSNNAINVTYGSSANTACQGNDSRLSNARPASDVYAWAKASTKPSYVMREISMTESYMAISSNTTIAPSYGNIMTYIITSNCTISPDGPCHFFISTSDTAPTISWANNVNFYGGTPPVIEANKLYEVDMLHEVESDKYQTIVVEVA